MLVGVRAIDEDESTLIGHCLKHSWDVLGRVSREVERDGHVPGNKRDNQLVEVAATDDEVAQTAAVDVAALAGQRQQGRVDKQFLAPVTVRAGGVLQVRPRPHVHLLPVGQRDIADGRGDVEEVRMQIAHSDV